MTRRRAAATRPILLDRSLEALPLFRLSDSADEGAVTYAPESGGRWRVLPAPGDRLPGTFDQDVYVELLHRYQEAGTPSDGVISFTLHAFLRSMDRRVDGRTYEQLRSALARLAHTVLESAGAYASIDAGAGIRPVDTRFSILTAVSIDRRRSADREQLGLFPTLTSGEPGDARVTLSPLLLANVRGGHTVTISAAQYGALPSATARRLYRLVEVARTEGRALWRVALNALAEQLPLTQRYPSHLQRVLQPAHDMLKEAGVVQDATVRQHQRDWFVDYVLAGRT
ncbi:MAG TPA: replication initiator protein A [Gemmatimonadaceae bacterium]|jgi:plasmid replication initiation protein|nr:replication initiator protein A [Gemmatimonadaceae bacterium]